MTVSKEQAKADRIIAQAERIAVRLEREHVKLADLFGKSRECQYRVDRSNLARACDQVHEVVKMLRELARR
jgi:hypothetical protein